MFLFLFVSISFPTVTALLYTVFSSSLTCFVPFVGVWLQTCVSVSSGECLWYKLHRFQFCFVLFVCCHNYIVVCLLYRGGSQKQYLQSLFFLLFWIQKGEEYGKKVGISSFAFRMLCLCVWLKRFISRDVRELTCQNNT